MKEKTYPSDNLDKFMLRLPDGMRDRIKAAADISGRSMNSEIVHRLEQSFDAAGFTTNYDEKLKELGLMFDSIKTAKRLLAGAERIEGETDDAILAFLLKRERSISEQFTEVLRQMKKQDI